MLPLFPEFKRIQLSDKEDVEQITCQFPPYSDYNFISLWSWDIREEAELSQLNGNLVVRFNDYLTGERFFSFLGTNVVNETARTLLDYAITQNINPVLKLIPQTTSDLIDSEQFVIEEERANFDYILSVKQMLPHDGTDRKLSSRRKLINKLSDLNNFYVRPINASSPEMSRQILALSLTWEEQRGVDTKDAKHLYQALVRALASNDTNENILSFGAFFDDKLVGYSINEVLGNTYALGHFQQADLSTSVGVYAFLMQEAAVYLSQLGCDYINLEQDLGIPGLRNWKLSYRPEAFLKKYTVSAVDK